MEHTHAAANTGSNLIFISPGISFSDREITHHPQRSKEKLSEPQTVTQIGVR
jgi:hypothetical protein